MRNEFCKSRISTRFRFAKGFKARLSLTILISFAACTAHASETDVANAILKDQFREYELAVEKDFQAEVIYKEWGKDAKISFAPQAADLNRDGLPDLVFFALAKGSAKTSSVGSQQVAIRHAILLACHGLAEQAQYKCFKVVERDMHYPLWFFHSIVQDIEKVKCPDADPSMKGAAISVNPALGLEFSMYWFNGTSYQLYDYSSCETGNC